MLGSMLGSIDDLDDFEDFEQWLWLQVGSQNLIFIDRIKQ
jgi:hypothetical protein